MIFAKPEQVSQSVGNAVKFIRNYTFFSLINLNMVVEKYVLHSSCLQVLELTWQFLWSLLWDVLDQGNHNLA